ncbi:MAG: hypothetical protein ACXWWQ_05380, partial [Candidatus Limnocylindria bacterium]
MQQGKLTHAWTKGAAAGAVLALAIGVGWLMSRPDATEGMGESPAAAATARPSELVTPAAATPARPQRTAAPSP